MTIDTQEKKMKKTMGSQPLQVINILTNLN